MSPDACLYCHAPLSGLRRRALFCSRVCKDAEAAARNRAEANAKRLEAAVLGDYADVVCVQCGRPWQRRVRGAGSQSATCSDVCKSDRRRDQMNAYNRRLRERAREAANQAKATARNLPAGPVARCNGCSHWTATGCRIEAFKVCRPFDVALHFRPLEARA